MKFKIIPNEQTPRVKPVKDILLFVKENYDMIGKFVSFARKQKKCIGLAANQVSLDGERIMYNFFVFKTPGYSWDIVINPKITKRVGKALKKEERCMTWIGKKLLVKRHYTVHVSGHNIYGEKYERIIHDLDSQIWQHEVDHLRGVKEVFK